MTKGTELEYKEKSLLSPQSDLYTVPTGIYIWLRTVTKSTFSKTIQRMFDAVATKNKNKCKKYFCDRYFTSEQKLIRKYLHFGFRNIYSNYISNLFERLCQKLKMYFSVFRNLPLKSKFFTSKFEVGF